MSSPRGPAQGTKTVGAYFLDLVYFGFADNNIPLRIKPDIKNYSCPRIIGDKPIEDAAVVVAGLNWNNVLVVSAVAVVLDAAVVVVAGVNWNKVLVVAVVTVVLDVASVFFAPNVTVASG